MNPHDPLAAPSKRRVFLRDAVLVLALNAVVALGLFLIGLALSPPAAPALVWQLMLIHMVFSQAIGLCIFGLIEWPRLTFWWQRPPGLLALGVVTGVAIPAGYVAGRIIASALFGLPVVLPLSLSPAALLVVFTTVLASLVAVHLITQRDRLVAERLRAENANVRAASARLQLLQQQIEPHMLFNTLANLRVLIALDPPRAQAMLDRLIGYLRATLGASRATLHPLSAEFDRLGDYLALMALRMGPRLQVTLDLPGPLRDLPVPPLLLQPLVENSIRHGLEPKVAGGRIEVRAEQRGNRLLLTVRDTGVGLAESADRSAVDGAPSGLTAGAAGPHSQYGTQHVAARLATMYGDQARFTLAAAPGPDGGTAAELDLPLLQPQPNAPPPQPSETSTPTR